MNHKRVLIVDDEEDLTWTIAKHLSKDKDHYELFTVNSGKEALKILNQVPIDLVVSDIRMPEISGLDLLLRIRESYPQTKVIIMTAYGSSEIQDEANERGCFKYIEKPFEIRELRKMILAGVEDRKGFEGRISDFQLSDLIQMNCLGRLTNALHIEKGLQKAIIYFEDGNITHCEVGDLQGEEAFYEIISWDGGTFQVERSVKAPKETIIVGWQSLLMEGLRRADEARNLEAQKRRVDPQVRRKQIQEILNEFVRNKDIILITIFSEEGFPIVSEIASDFEGRFDISGLTPLMPDLFTSAQETGQQLKLKSTRDVLIEYENGWLSLCPIPDTEDYFAVLAKNSMNLAVLRMETKKIARILQNIYSS